MADSTDPSVRANAGITARIRVPLLAHAELGAAQRRPDPVEVLLAQAVSRVPELVPVRHGRMLVSPFTFFRGAAAVMAADLAATPASGFQVQACGDAHLTNFGVFASPERRLMFDLNDFDETHPAPWEWDVKRLAASLVVAARGNGFDRKTRRKIVLDTVGGYRQAMIEFAGQKNLEVWYARADVDEIGPQLMAQLDKERRRRWDAALSKARTRDSLQAMNKLTAVVDGRRRFVADPPLLVPVEDLLPRMARAELEGQLRGLLHGFTSSLVSDRRHLLEAFEFVDMARKVVGVGSVGTRCWVVLLQGRDEHDPLLLQIKEAQRSVLAEHVRGTSGWERYRNEGERVVAGQRLMQAASDIFLGWETVEGIDGQRRDFYVRQLRDWKGSVVIEAMVPQALRLYGRLCGWTLARAHARSGDRIAIAAYLGEDDTFDRAVAEFAERYADVNETDYAALAEAVRTGRVEARAGL
jgi:uncharacterized protein (DUF2252 family)